MTAPFTAMIVAGEASGDVYGARVAEEIRRHVPDAALFGIGGDRMAEHGVELLFHIRDTSIMGFLEVARRLPFILRVMRTCRAALRERPPDVLIPIDYPGFNLRLARHAKAAGVPVLYYISPQVWAWGRNRSRKMRSVVDRMAVVFPFEEAIYDVLGIPATFVGHPLLEILRRTDRADFLARTGLPDAPVLAMLPGSRAQEIDHLLPTMVTAALDVRRRTGCSLAIGASHLPDELYLRHIGRHPEIALLRDATHALMEHAHAAIVTSGTATVETAFYRTPMVIVYRTSAMNYEIGRRLINVPFIGMANILAGESIVPELVQHNCTPERIVAELLPLFTDPQRRERMVADLGRVRDAMGTPGASGRVADMALSLARDGSRM